MPHVQKIIPSGDDLLLRIDALIKTKTPSFHQHHVVYSPEMLSRFLNIAMGVLKGIEMEVFPPNPARYCQDVLCGHTVVFILE